jgi:hypothetical protein
MPLPNFFIIGAGRSGTTSLYHYLKQHPDVYMSPKKEPNYYFLEGVSDKLRGNGTSGWLKTCTATRDAYLAQFAGVTTEKAVGEASVGYLSNEGAPAAIHRDVPDARLFVILRHPVERAYASYMGMRLSGREPATTFREALDREASRMAENWSFGGYRRDGLYCRQLNRYYSLFDREQMRIFLFEDFKSDPAAVVQDILATLEVDTSFVPDTSVRHNPTGSIRNPLARFVWRHSLPVRTGLRNYLPAALRDWAFPFFTKSGLVKPPMPEEIRHELLEFYRPDIEKLQDLIDRDLSYWLVGNI